MFELQGRVCVDLKRGEVFENERERERVGERRGVVPAGGVK